MGSEICPITETTSYQNSPNNIQLIINNTNGVVTFCLGAKKRGIDHNIWIYIVMFNKASIVEKITGNTFMRKLFCLLFLRMKFICCGAN